MTRQLLRIGMAVMTTLLALVVFWQFRTVVMYMLFSVALTAALRPLVKKLARGGWLVRVAWILLFLAVVVCFAFLLFRTGGSAVREIQQLAQRVSLQDKWQLPLWLEGSSFQQVLIARLPPPGRLFEAITGEQGQLVLPTIFGFLQGVGGGITGILLILFLSIYWSISQVHFERLWLSLLPADQRRQTRGIWRTIEPDIGAYIRSEVIQSLLIGLLVGLGSWLLGSPYPALLALAVALACLIPMVGEAIAIIAVLLVGLLTNLQFGLLTALIALVVVIALRIWVQPRLFNRKWDNPILTIVLLIALADAFGLVGIIAAPPISAICQILWNRLVTSHAISEAAVNISNLKERQAHVQDVINAMEEPHLPLVINSMQRLTRLMEEAEPILQTDQITEQSGSSKPAQTDTDQAGTSI